jgi:hypothetical protein
MFEDAGGLDGRTSTYGEVAAMATFKRMIDEHNRLIIGIQTFLILFFVLACTFHDVVPVCHYLFGCDHAIAAVRYRHPSSASRRAADSSCMPY